MITTVYIHTILIVVDILTDTVPESVEFQVVSLDGKIWELETASAEETDHWVKAIEEQIKKTYTESTSHKRMVYMCVEIRQGGGEKRG